MKKKNQKFLLPAIVFVISVGLWEFYVRAFDISLYILPAPSKVVQSLVENWDVLMMQFRSHFKRGINWISD